MTKRPSNDSAVELSEWLAVRTLEAADTGELPVMEWGLKPVVSTPSFTEYWREVWDRRAFIWADAKAKAYQTTRGTFLGKAWLIIQPFFNALIFYIIFGIMLKVSRGIPNFLGYLVIGVSFFPVYNAALSSGSQALNASRNLIRAFTFPRASIVVAWSLRSFLDFLPVAIATMLFVIVIPPHITPTPLWLLVIPTVVIGFVFGNGLALLLSAITAAIPDLKFVWPLFGRFWFYVSGVFFSVDRFQNQLLVSLAMQANPAYVFLTIVRDLMIYNRMPSALQWIYLTVWSVGMWLVGAVVFWLREEKYGEELS